jgi:hypothetical protein
MSFPITGRRPGRVARTLAKVAIVAVALEMTYIGLYATKTAETYQTPSSQQTTR